MARGKTVGARVAGERDDRWPRAAKEDRGSAERSGKLAQVAQVHTQPEDAGDQPLSYRGAVTTAWPGSAGGDGGLLTVASYPTQGGAGAEGVSFPGAGSQPVHNNKSSQLISNCHDGCACSLQATSTEGGGAVGPWNVAR